MRARRESREKLYQGAAYLRTLARIAANVRRLREARGWTQEEAAFQCDDLASPLLRRIELAASNVTALTLTRLAEGFGVDIAELLAPVEVPPPRKVGRPRKVPSATPPEGATRPPTRRKPAE